MNTPPILHLFRRDLRLQDNTALNALPTSQPIALGFIFDPAQVSDANRYKSLFALRFLCESLQELAREIKAHGGVLNIWYGKPTMVIKQLAEAGAISGISTNADYTPFSLSRDAALADMCDKTGITFHQRDDTLLTIPGTVRTGAGQPFKVFTPFYKAALQQEVAEPVTASFSLCKTVLSGADDTIPAEITKQYADLPATHITSGRTAALSILASLADHKTYKKDRDFPSKHGTTRLSAHHKFGTVSAREVYHALTTALGDHAGPLTRQLYWRDFFTHVAVAFPHVFGSAFQKQYNNISWRNNKQDFERWCTGTTGFPIVDAGMRELNATGYMHNRARMITASFLVKDLHIDWRWGEQYFARTLVDYDPCVNNGSWQWAASTGCDAQPYFRIFNPWLQQKRFDPDATYIKQWVPELKGVRPAALHALDKTPLNIPNYPSPMVDHKVVSTRAKEMFKEVA